VPCFEFLARQSRQQTAAWHATECSRSSMEFAQWYFFVWGVQFNKDAIIPSFRVFWQLLRIEVNH